MKININKQDEKEESIEVEFNIYDLQIENIGATRTAYGYNIEHTIKVYSFMPTLEK